MKASYAAFGVVLLALAGLWFAGGGSAMPAQSAAAAELPRVSAPLSHNNLTVYFIHGPDTVADTHKVATLQEALAAGWAVVNETGNVNTLTVQNNSDDYELFIQEGDMIKGGKQDRVFAVDMLVPPKSGVVPFPAHCVESGRWTNRGNESATQFSKSDNFAVGKGLRYANATQQQGEVWKNVAENQQKLSSNLKTSVNNEESKSSFQLTLENKDLQAKVSEFEAALRDAGASRKNVIGVVFYVNGQVTGAEVYGSNALFQKAWPKLLKSQAADAIQETTDKTLPPNPSVQEVERFLAMAGKSDAPKSEHRRANAYPAADNDLTNEDPGMQSNLEVALPESQREEQTRVQSLERNEIRTRSGSTRTRGAQAAGGQAGAIQVANPQPIDQEVERVQHAIDNVQVQRDAVVVSTGNRLSVKRVEDGTGLCSESRDPTRQNALIHKSFIKK